jgi:hypothetical protein
MEQVVYQPRPGYRINQEQADRYGKALHSLEEELGREVTTEEVLAAATPENSPLHDFFDWDNKSAARKYRLWQAMRLSRCVLVRVIVKEKPVEIPQKMRVTVTHEDGTVRVGYMQSQRVLATPELRKQVLHDALRRAKKWRADYKFYKELGPIFEAIDRVEREIE